MSSIDFDDAYARARDEWAFSNGTEYYAWYGNWCGRCRREQPFINGITDKGCPLLLVALNNRTPAEWLEQDGFRLGDQYHCVEFRGLGGGGGGEPRPKPDPRGMDGLFPRTERRTRMFVQPQSSKVEVGA